MPESPARWLHPRTSFDPRPRGGVPCIRDLRIPVAAVLAITVGGMTPSEIVTDFSDLDVDDVRKALRYAA